MISHREPRAVRRLSTLGETPAAARPKPPPPGFLPLGGDESLGLSHGAFESRDPRRKLMNLAEEISRKLGIPRGQTMAEYALIVATIVVVSVSLFKASGSIVSAILNRVLPLFTG
jgi:Flp pilus assembly pilin Flp